MAEYIAQLGLNDEQKRLLLSFKKELKIPDGVPFDGVADDLTLFRFISAKKWVMADALKQYRSYREWREEEEMDKLDAWADNHKDEIELIESLFPLSQHGWDKEGRPLIYEDIGVIPAARFAKLVKMPGFHKWHVWWMEKLMRTMREQTKKLGKPVYKVTCIVNMQGSSFESRHFVPFFKVMSQCDEQNYPEIVQNVFCVNSPWIFPALYALVKNFIDPNTREKIQVFSSGYEKKLLEHVDAKVLNVKFGGQNKEVLPTVTGIKVTEAGKEDLTSKNVAARDSYVHTVKCDDRHGGKFMWIMELKELDITLKVEWKGHKDKKATLVSAHEKVDRASGHFDAKTRGELTLTMDNTYSYLTSKDVRYAVTFQSKAVLKTNAIIEQRKAKAAAKAAKDAAKRKKKADKAAAAAKKREETAKMEPTAT